MFALLIVLNMRVIVFYLLFEKLGTVQGKSTYSGCIEEFV